MINSWDATDEAAWQKTPRDGKAKTAAQPKKDSIDKMVKGVRDLSGNTLQRSLPLPSDSSETKRLMRAQHIVGAAMGGCLGVWFVPLSGLYCNRIEQQMVRGVLTALGADATDAVVENVFWCCRKKLLVLNVATYVPYAGTSFQLLEVYALGQFTIHCATHYSDMTDKEHLSESWAAIEQQIFSGNRVIKSYEEATGKQFPEAIKAKFVPAVDAMRRAYTRAERIPGLMQGQEIAGEAMHVVVKTGKKLAVRIWRKVTDTGR
jgi:hypothetical protein